MASLSTAGRNFGGYQLAVAPVSRAAAPRAQRRGHEGGGDAGHSGRVIVERCAIAELPEEHASRRERFSELDELQGGWAVELREKPGSDLVDAVFYSPEGVFHKTYAAARRAALEWKKAQGG